MSQLGLFQEPEAPRREVPKAYTELGTCTQCKEHKELLGSVFEFSHPTKATKAAGKPHKVTGVFCSSCWDIMWTLYNQSTNLTVQNMSHAELMALNEKES